VWDVSESSVAAVDADDCAETILQVVATGGFKMDTIKFKPDPPEHSREKADMAVQRSTSVSAVCEVYAGLCEKVDHSDDTVRCQKPALKCVYDGVEAGLSFVSKAIATVV
jgi:hypothetical protein